MTKRRVLEICRDLWLWLSDNTSRYKGEWPGWKTNKGNAPDCVNYCPCCEQCEMDCSQCALINLWPIDTDKNYPPFLAYCTYIPSPYKAWLNAKTSKNVKKYALIIANGAIVELEKMDKKKEKS